MKWSEQQEAKLRELCLEGTKSNKEIADIMRIRLTDIYSKRSAMGLTIEKCKQLKEGGGSETMTKLEFEKITIKGTISYLKSWVETMQDRIAKEDPKTLLCEVYEERIAFISKAIEALSDKKCIRLPVPIGEPIYVPFRFEDADGTIDEGVEVLHLSGYVNEDGREFYLTYDEFGTNDIPVENAYLTREEAKKRLKNDKGEI